MLACERSRIPEAKRAECVDSLKRQEQLTGVLSFEGFTNVMDKHRDILNYLIQSSSNPLLHIYK